MIPRGMSCSGSRASSAARGTPSTPRNSHMPKGSARDHAAHAKRQGLARTGGCRSDIKKVSHRERRAIPTAKTTMAATAMSVMPKVTLRASPTAHDLQPHEHGEEDGDDERRGHAGEPAQRVHIVGDEGRDGGGADGKINRMAKPVKAPPTFSHRAAGESVARTRRGHGATTSRRGRTT